MMTDRGGEKYCLALFETRVAIRHHHITILKPKALDNVLTSHITTGVADLQVLAL